MKIISVIVTLTLLISCSEDQVFDISFKENERYYLAGYCEPTDNLCPSNVDKFIDVCFEESDYDPSIFSSIIHVDWTNPQEAQKTMEHTDFSEMDKFKETLNNCMANRIGGSFAKNMQQGKVSWMTDMAISSPTNQSNPPTKRGSNLLIAIKGNGDIWVNKEIVKLKDIRSLAEQFILKNPNVNAVIIHDKDSSISDFVSVMDQLKFAGIENISLSATKPN